MPRQGYELIPDGNSLAPERSSRSRVGIIVAVGSVLVFLMQFPSLNNNGTGNASVDIIFGIKHLSSKLKCAIAVKRASPDLLETDKYESWFAADSTMHLAQSGTFNGPAQMTEYVDFTKSIYFDKYYGYDSQFYFSATKGGGCEMMIASLNKMQVKPEYSKSGEGVCITTTLGFKLSYSAGWFGSGFTINRVDLFYPEKFLPMLFNDAIGGEVVADYICDTVLLGNCEDVYQANGLDNESCKAMYNDLPPVDDYGYIDDKSKGCRILHSAFAEVNKKHCPHMSFIPIKDDTGTLWCQESGGKKAEDLFTEDELSFIGQVASDKGFDPDTLSATCDYEPVGYESDEVSAASGPFTLVHRNAIAVAISGLVLFAINNSLAT